MTEQQLEQKTTSKIEKEGSPCSGARSAATTLAGASMGVVVGIAGITAAALAEIVLPVALCLWATGLAGGAMGLLNGCKKKEKNNV